MRYLRNSLLSLLLAFGAALVARADFEEDYESKKWQEMEVLLPAAPRPENLLPFEVSAASANRFFVDGSTLSVGRDGVVRYVLVILSPQGARNVTFEGMRCEAREYRIYAAGRLDGSWSKARKNDWVRIQEEYANRYHAALFLDFFCPVGVIVRDAAEARNALVKGIHPEVEHPDTYRW